MLTRNRVLAAVAVALLSSPFAAQVAAAQGSDQLAVTASVAGRDLASVDANDPLQLQAGEDAVLDLSVRNNGSAEVRIRSVRLDGRVVGLTFFTFSTRVDLVVPPGEVGQRRYAIDLGDLGDQATGLIPARLALLDQERDVLTAQEFPVDVRGSMTSVYGVFALGIAAASALLLLGLVVRLFAGLLPRNRWSRAVRFAWPGAGLGLTLAFTASALRIAVPSPRVALGTVLVGMAIGFVAGYLSPQRAELSYDLDDRDLAQPASVAAQEPDVGLQIIDLREAPEQRSPVATRDGGTTLTPGTSGTSSS